MKNKFNIVARALGIGLMVLVAAIANSLIQGDDNNIGITILIYFLSCTIYCTLVLCIGFLGKKKKKKDDLSEDE